MKKLLHYLEQDLFVPDEAFRAEQIRMLYSNLPASILMHILLGILFVSIQNRVIDIADIIIWVSLLALVLLMRVTLILSWKRSWKKTQTETQKWLSLFRLLVVMTSATWGIGGIMLYPTDDVVHQIFIGFVFSGLCAGSVTVLSIDRISVFGFALPMLLPYTVMLLMEADQHHMNMALMIILFFIFISISARQSGLSLIDNHHLRIKAAERELRFRLLLEYSPVATRIIDKTTHKIMFANQSYISLIGISEDDVIGIEPTQYYAYPQEYTEVLEQLNRGESITNRQVELVIDGKSKWILASYFQIEYQDRPAILAWLYDITDRKQMEEKVQHLAYHDVLTGLPNRILLKDRLELALSKAEREKFSVALMFVDLDKFKPVNDTYGHEVGDLLLKAVAERVQSCLRKSDSIARIGGDEFVILLSEIDNSSKVLWVAEKVRMSLNQPFELADLILEISCSIGIAVYPEHATEEQQLVRYADAAMYHAKRDGRNNVKLYEAEMKEINGEARITI